MNKYTSKQIYKQTNNIDLLLCKSLGDVFVETKQNIEKYLMTKVSRTLRLR